MPGVWERQKPKQANAAPATSSTPIILRKTGFRFRRFCGLCRECRFVDAACLACSIPSALLPLKMVEDAETLQLCDHVTHIVQARLLFCKIDSSIYCAICKNTAGICSMLEGDDLVRTAEQHLVVAHDVCLRARS